MGEEDIKERITLRRQRKSRNARISVEQQRKCFHTEPIGGEGGGVRDVRTTKEKEDAMDWT